MKAEPWTRVSELFCGALELPRAERPAFLARSGADGEVRAEVERLLGLHERDDGTLAGPLAPLRAPGLAAGARIGRYRIERVLGAGGMGTVFEALQDSPRRTVALKTLRLGLSSPERVQRFLFEAEVLGTLRHPAIAQIYESGTHEEAGESFPWFAMELVAGARDVVEFARGEELSLEERLALFVQVCEAVHHGHQKGVIHRDLKPGNILVDAEGRPKVIDFGVARAARADELAPGTTRVGQLVGTLSTMSPEQLAGDPAQVDARSDVYSLGVVLHELVTGAPPYELSGLSLEQALRVVREARAPRAPGAPDELRWVLARALERDPARRYASASELAADLRRLAAREPVLAGPPSRAYLARKFVQRHRLAVAASAALLLVLLAGIAGTSWQAAEARARRRDAETQGEIAESVARFLDELLRSSDPELARGHEQTTRELFDFAAQRIEGAFPDRPEVEAALRITIGRSYQGLGRFEDAERHLRAARELYRGALGDEDRRTLEASSFLAGALHDLDRWREAAELGRATLDSCRRELGEDDPQTIAAACGLAPSLTALSDFEGAEALLRGVLARARAHGLFAGEALTNLAYNALGAGRFAEAEGHYRAALAERRGQEGDDAPATLAVMTDLADVLVRQGKVADARALLDEAVQTSVRVLGPAHPRTLMRRCCRANLLLHEERDAEAEAEYRALVDATRDGPSDARLAALNGLSMAVDHQGRRAEAVEVGRECLELARRTYGADDPNTLVIQTNVARNLRLTGEREASLELLEPAHAGFERQLGAAHPSTLTARLELGMLLRDLGERDAALELLERVLADGAGSPDAAYPVRCASEVLERLRASVAGGAGD